MSKNVVCVGIGGGALYYIAKYFLFLGASIRGFDISKTEKTIELETLGAEITYHNPEEPLRNIDLLIYSNALPNKLIAQLTDQYPNTISVDEFYEDLLTKYEADELTAAQVEAIKQANVAPLYELDTSKVTLIGVTGTDGKTTTTEMLYSILTAAGFKVGLVNTIKAKIGEDEIDTGFHVTTPSAQENAKLLKKMLDVGCTHIILECTSQGLKTGRLAGLKFDFAVYTNITAEHLDFHKTLENLIEAKSFLIKKHLKPTGWAILNADNANIFTNLAGQFQNELFYSTVSQDGKFITAANIQETGTSLEFDLVEAGSTVGSITIPMIGLYNVSNALAAISVGLKLGVAVPVIADGLAKLPVVTGRTQVIQREPFYVLVDFAHTPNGLANVLNSVRHLVKQTGKLIVVFGCAGKRDPSKRFPMGETAGKLADITILTAEDPRSESLTQINSEIETGWKATATANKQLIRFDDDSHDVQVRRDAIKIALELAKPGDVVIMCGKAHEKSLCFGNTEYPWNDIDETKKLLGL